MLRTEGSTPLDQASNNWADWAEEQAGLFWEPENLHETEDWLLTIGIDKKKQQGPQQLWAPAIPAHPAVTTTAAFPALTPASCGSILQIGGEGDLGQLMSEKQLSKSSGSKSSGITLSFLSVTTA